MHANNAFWFSGVFVFLKIIKKEIAQKKFSLVLQFLGNAPLLARIEQNRVYHFADDPFVVPESIKITRPQLFADVASIQKNIATSGGYEVLVSRLKALKKFASIRASCVRLLNFFKTCFVNARRQYLPWTADVD